MSTSTLRRFALPLAFAPLLACGGSPGSTEPVGSSEQAFSFPTPPPAFAFQFAGLDNPIAGVAGTSDVVFVGEPLNGTVVVLSRYTGAQIAELTPPPEGFAIPFIMHIVGDGKLAILGAGGLPQPAPFTPANPFIYEYDFSYSHHGGFSATMVRDASFESALIGFSEDFVHLDDGRYLISDSILGSIWILEPDGTVLPGIVPKTFDPSDFIPLLAFCPTMPEITVNGYPFLFSGSTIPGVSPLAVRNGNVYYYSPCARGIYTFPLDILTDGRQPYQRAASISLVAPTPSAVQVEELLDFTFNPYDPFDNHLYAADPLVLSVIRIDSETGQRETLASGSGLFDFPSSLGFLPPVFGISQLVVASNQQERSPLTNDEVTTTTFNLPFVVAQIEILP
jgi:hypothetical protein